jgi:hypothetical protein
MSIGRKIFRVVGRRAFLTFGLVTFLVGALLATVNVTSRYALKLYVDDQLRRTPWDLAVYQRGVAGQKFTFLQDQLATVDGVTRIERLAFLRARFPEGAEVVAEVDGSQVTAPWLSLLAASDLSILPPEVGFALDRGGSGAVLAIMGPHRTSGQAFLELQGAQNFSVHVAMNDGRRDLFETPLRGVIRLDRDELLRWLMDQIGSVSYVPYVGLVLLMPYDQEVLARFDTVSSGFLPLEMVDIGAEDYGHIQLAEYEPEVTYLGRLDRARLISGWDIGGSLARVNAVHERVRAAARGDETGNHSFTVDGTTGVLLARMDAVARLVGLLSLLVALPLLWMAWVLAANLSGLLMLNERRTLGLMRLRGISGRLLGRSFLIAIAAGGLAGGILGLIVGSVGPLLIYERGGLPLDVLLERRQLALFAVFLLVSLALALLVSRRLVRYVTTISPLEASGRVAGSEATQAAVRFGSWQALALAAGTYVLVRWIMQFSIAEWYDQRLALPERALDFLGLPLFLYGLSTLLASRRRLIERLMRPLVRPIGGPLGRFAARHISVKPHRTVAFLLVVALMASVSLYPTVTGASFQNKAERGARVMLGADWQLIFNAPDFADAERLQGSLVRQLGELKPAIARTLGALESVDGVARVTYLVEAVLPNFYLPGYGLKGVPLYLVGDTNGYLANTYSEPEVGLTSEFRQVIVRTAQGEVAAAPPVADFWRLEPGTPIVLGTDADRTGLSAATSGTIAFLPGLPPRTVTDRQGYVQARVDYLNYLFNSNAYVVAAADNAGLGALEVLIPRVIVLVNARDTSRPAALGPALVRALPFAPLEAHNVADEIGKVGTDMYIALALANMRIYLVGGLLLASIAIVAIGMANYTEDRRTLGLLRIRGAAPPHLWRFLLAMLVSPALLGLALGSVVALVAGFGLATYVWDLRELRTVVQLLPTRLVLSPLAVTVMAIMLTLLAAVATGFSWWEYRRTAHENVRG